MGLETWKQHLLHHNIEERERTLSCSVVHGGVDYEREGKLRPRRSGHVSFIAVFDLNTSEAQNLTFSRAAWSWSAAACGFSILESI
ncbi:hypothetical protein E2542_SST19885 [Spatholobus suberectus]|nr:hypothetical protein E2542_SST19885 [Spatholobus suberectus]